MSGEYRTIVADPPWDHSDGTGVNVTEKRVTGLSYDTMTLSDIAALPVHQLSTNLDQDAHLYLWTTGRFLRSAFDIVGEWGFRYAATLVWCKPSRGWSTGGAFQNNVEFILFAKRPKLTTRSEEVKVSAWLKEQADRVGITEADINEHMGTRRMAMWWISENPRMAAVPSLDKWEKLRHLIGFGPEMDEAVKTINAAKGTERTAAPQIAQTRWFEWPRGEHSAKPEAFIDLVEQVSPGPYVELFARRARFGWDYWGNESLGTAEMAA